jgi:cysteine desulfurase family protein
VKVIYLDNAATTYPKPECVYQAVDRFNREAGGNPGRGGSRATLEAGSVVLEAREAVARLFNAADSTRVCFALNVTESLNTALKGILEPGDHVITSAMEHNAVARPLFALQSRGIEWTVVPCGPDGSLDPEDVRRAIRPHTRMVCVLHASNVTGTIMPIAEIGRITRQHGVLFVVDAAQTAGVLPLDVEAQHIDILAFAGHKGLLGPQGTGGMYVRPGVTVRPLKEGGTGSRSESLQQPDFLPDALESGTMNTPGIAGLLAGVEYVRQQGLDVIRAHERRLTDLLLDGLREIPGCQVLGPASSLQRTAVVSFNLEGVDCGEVSMALDHRYGIMTRSGLHCAPLAHATLGTLERGACRMSPGYFTSEEDVAFAVRAVADIARRSRP